VDSVAPIRDANPTQVRLSVKESKLARMHPSELAGIIGDLSAPEAAAVVRQLDDETAADAFEHLDADTQKTLIDDIGTERAADIIEEMDSDDAADLLAELDEERQRELLAEMSEYTASELRELVKYPEDTAGGLMTTDYTWIYPHRTAEATIRKIREIAPTSEFIYYLFVVDRKTRCWGALAAHAAARGSLRDDSRHHGYRHHHGSSDMEADDVAATIARYDLMAVPVITNDGKMLGIVTVDDAIDAIMPKTSRARFRTSPRDAAARKRRSQEFERGSRRYAAAPHSATPASRRRGPGPGFITASAGNDVGGIATYSQAGAQFGYSLLWSLIPIAVALIVVQEMATRMDASRERAWRRSSARISACAPRSSRWRRCSSSTR